MNTCYIIKPADSKLFDQRYDEIYKYILENSSVDPYMIPRGPGIIHPPGFVEESIMAARICFADLTVGDPDLWYELGFAIGTGKYVVLVAEEGVEIPANLQQQHIIRYFANTQRDNENLGKRIKERLSDLLQKQNAIDGICGDGEFDKVMGPNPLEFLVLMLLDYYYSINDETPVLYLLKRDIQKGGHDPQIASGAIHQLKRKGLITNVKLISQTTRKEYDTLMPTKEGKAFIRSDQSKFVLPGQNRRKVGMTDLDVGQKN